VFGEDLAQHFFKIKGYFKPPPDIFFSRKHLNNRLKQCGVKKMSASYCSRIYGCCYLNVKVIFIEVKEAVFMKTQDYLDTLAHELQHWYFPEMEHGLEFDKRVKEIIRRSGHGPDRGI
jgi:hypothetical protein